MGDQQQLEAMAAILQTFSENSNVLSSEIPLSVLRRLAMLTGGQKPQYVDAHIFPTDDWHRVSGEVIVMTDNVIIQATLRATPKDETRAYTVTVGAWARRDLVSLNITPDEGEGRNPDSSWSESWREWPPQSFISLNYNVRSISLPLAPDPSKWSRQQLTSLLPSLLADLSRDK
ncbi:MAG: hypothetical protein ACJ74O_02660 [Frankiaceae bacterium]